MIRELGVAGVLLGLVGCMCRPPPPREWIATPAAPLCSSAAGAFLADPAPPCDRVLDRELVLELLEVLGRGLELALRLLG